MQAGARGGEGGGGGEDTDLEEPAKRYANEAAAQGNIARAHPAVQQALPRPSQISKQPLACLPPYQYVSFQHQLANQASITKKAPSAMNVEFQPQNKCVLDTSDYQHSKADMHGLKTH